MASGEISSRMAPSYARSLSTALGLWLCFNHFIPGRKQLPASKIERTVLKRSRRPLGREIWSRSVWEGIKLLSFRETGSNSLVASSSPGSIYPIFLSLMGAQTHRSPKSDVSKTVFCVIWVILTEKRCRLCFLNVFEALNPVLTCSDALWILEY